MKNKGQGPSTILTSWPKLQQDELTCSSGEHQSLLERVPPLLFSLLLMDLEPSKIQLELRRAHQGHSE